MGLSPFDLTAVKKSSLIFQLTNRLLLHPEQYKQPGAYDANQVDKQSDVMNADESLSLHQQFYKYPSIGLVPFQ